MPIFRYRDKLILFSHIPKCAGQSVENYCKKIGMKIAFLDNQFNKSSSLSWCINSPQHITGFALSRLFTNDFFDFSFAVVRNPIDRLRSAFKFQKYKERKIKKNLTLSNFIRSDLELSSRYIGYFDNHFLPQVDLLMNKNSYKIFKLEEGLLEVKKYIDDIFLTSNLNINMEHINSSKFDPNFIDEDNYIDDLSFEIIYSVYKKDFESFGYKI